MTSKTLPSPSRPFSFAGRFVSTPVSLPAVRCLAQCSAAAFQKHARPCEPAPGIASTEDICKRQAVSDQEATWHLVTRTFSDRCLKINRSKRCAVGTRTSAYC